MAYQFGDVDGFCYNMFPLSVASSVALEIQFAKSLKLIRKEKETCYNNVV